MPNQNVPKLKELPENDPIDFDDSLIDAGWTGRQVMDIVRQWSLCELLS